MWPFDIFAKRRELEAQQKRELQQRRLVTVAKPTPYYRASAMTRNSSVDGTSSTATDDLLNPINPLSPLNPMQQFSTWATPADEPRHSSSSHCDTSSSHSSHSSSDYSSHSHSNHDYSCSSSSYDSGSSSSYDSGSSSSSRRASTWPCGE